MTTVFHTWLHGRFIEIQSNLMRKKLHRMKQDSNFFWRQFFSNRDNVRASIQFRRENQLQHLKRYFSSRTDLFIFNSSLAPVLLDWSNKTSRVFPALKSTSHFLPQSTVSHRSDSSSDANSSCCHRSDA